MSRAVIVADGFDPAPSLAGTVGVSVVDAVPGGVDAVGIPVGAEGDVPAVLALDRDALAAAGFTGAVGSALPLARAGGPLHVAIGTGATLDAAGARDAGAAFAQSAGRHAALAVRLDGDLAAFAAPFVEGVLLARYAYTPLQREPRGTPLQSLVLVVPPGRMEAVEAAARRGHALARAGMLARDLANSPPAHLTATRLADLVAEHGPAWGLEVEVFDRDALVALGCGGLLGVNGGSDEAPRMVKATYRPAGDAPHVALVGKGIMYDSGGLSLKPSDAVHATMKNDMSGAAAVVGALSVLRELGCPTAVTAYLMCTDNMPSGTALKLGDVITIHGGTTVEVVNTDAEGRLVMADALVMAAALIPDAIVDIATLTGAAMRALGTAVGGVMGNDPAVVQQARDAGEATDEPLWELPLVRRYRRELDSDVADLKNLGGANAGAITAGLFLEEFVAGLPWVHIDIAGTAQTERPERWLTQGCSGFGARLLVELLCGFQRPG